MKRIQKLLIFVAALIAVARPGLSGTISKNNTAGNLNTTNVWVGGVVPGSGDIAQWDTNDTTQTSASLGGSMTWLGIKVASNLTAASYTINSTAGTTLTLGTSGIDMSVANKNFTINSALNVGGTQTWSVATGRTLTIGGNVTNNANLLTIAGAGTETVSGIISGSGGLTMSGTGVLTLSGVNTYTGQTTVNDGTLSLTTAGKISSSSPLVLGGGNLVLAINGDTTQTFNGTTVKSGFTSVTSSGGNGSHTYVAALGSLVRSNAGGGTVDFSPSGSGGHSTTSTNVSSILGAFATFGGSDWASVSGGQLAAPSYTTLPSSGSSATVNYSLTGSASLTANESVNTLKLNTSGNGQSLNLGTRTLTLSGNGLLFIGGNNYIISNGNWTAGNSVGAYELIVHHYGSGNLTNNAVIQNNGANAVALTFSGTGRLILGAANTYSGGTVVNAGTLEGRAPNSLNGGNVRVHSGGTLVLSTNTCMATSAGLLLDGNAPSVNLNYGGTLTQEVAALSFDGGLTYRSLGTWGSTNSTATNKNTRFTGSGILRVAFPATTTIALTSGSNTSTYGSALTFTATVTGTNGTPTGNVTFKDGSTTIGTGTLDGSAQATFSTNGFSVAGSPHLIAVTYGGDTNYSSSTSAMATQTITAATLTVTPNAVLTIYSATTLNNTSYSQNTNNYTFSGFQNGQTVVSAVVTLSGSMAFNGSTSTSVRNAGTYTQAVGTLALSSANNNYAVSFSNPTPNNYVITNAVLTITAVTNTKTYDGTNTAAATPTPSGLQGSDTVTGLKETYDNKNVGTGKTLSVSAYTVNDGNSGGNYNVTTVPNTTGVINARALTVSATGVNKVYDATTNATVTLSDNRVSGDVLTTDYTSGSFANKNVGTGKTVSVSGISVTGTDAGNYTFNTTASTTANITAATVTGSITASNKVYDANNTASIASSSLNGVLSNDVVSLSGGTATFDNQNVGTGKIVTATGLSLSGADAGNYVLSSTTATTTGDITPAALTVTADDKTRAFGYPNPPLTASYAGFAGLENTNVLSGAPDLSTTADTNSVMGTYPITVTNGTLSAANYTFNFVDGTLTVGKAPLTVAADNQSRLYGETNPVLTVTYSGFVNGDSITNAVSGDPDISTTATTNSPVAGSPYDIVVTNGTLSVTDYYDLVFTNGHLTVTPAPVTGSIFVSDKGYDGTTAASIASNALAGVLFNDGVSLTGGTATFDNQNAGNGKTVTATGLSLTGAQAGNYLLTTNTATTIANIMAATVTGSITASNKTYDGDATATIATRTLSGVIGSNDVSLAGGTATFADKNAGTGKTVTATSLSLSGADAANYQLASTSANTAADITARELIVSATGVNKIYDGDTTAMVALSDNRVSGDVLTTGYTSASFANKAVDTGKTVNVSGISVTGTDAGNYTFNTSTSTTANITSRELIVSATGVNKVYDGTTTAIVTLSDNRVVGDVLTTAYTTAEFADENIGDGKPVSVTGITVTGADAGNYTFNTTASTTANITAPTQTAPSITCPADIVLTNAPGECTSNIAFAASASGQPTPTVLYSIDSIAVTSPYSFPVGTTMVDSTASNDAGIATCSFTVTVVDIEPPVISVCATDLTVSCAADVPAPDSAAVTATDNCSAVTVSFVSDTITNQSCANRYTVLRTYQAIDAFSNSATCTQTITIDDQIAPIITASPADITVGCAASVPAPDDAAVTATDNCNGLITVTHDADVISTQTCANRYTISRTYHATDACGNSSSVTQTITVNDQAAPILGGQGAHETIESPATPVFTAPTASDNCDATPVISASDVTNHLCGTSYSVTRTWTATDACGNTSAPVSQTIIVTDTTSPTITCPDNMTVRCALDVPTADISFVTATDAGAVTITFEGDEVSAQTCPNRYTITRTYKATDACGNSATCTQTITVNDTTVPILGGQGGDETIESPATPVFTPPTASDDCDAATIISASDVTNQLCGTSYSVTRTWSATDSCGNTSAPVSQTITVHDTTPPAIGCPAEVTTNTDVGQCYATGVVLGDVTLSETNGSITVTNNAPEQFPTGTNAVVWTVADTCNNVAICTQLIIVVDTEAPTISACPTGLTVQCALGVPEPDIATVTATDACSAVTISFGNDEVSDQTCSNRYIITRTYKATDAAGNSTICTQTIVVADETAPALSGAPADATVGCNSVPAPAEVTASDNCEGSVPVSFSETSTQTTNGCSQFSYTITRTWTATDSCGNTASTNQTLTVQDTAAPVLSCPADQQLACGTSTAPEHTGTATAADICDPNPTVSYSDTPTATNCTGHAGIDRTWTAADACGNSTGCVQHITFTSTAPVISCPTNVTVSCEVAGDLDVTGRATATNDCGGAITITHSDAITAGSCSNNYTITRTWTATDACGNTSAPVNQTIIVTDTTPPTITCPAEVTAGTDPGQTFASGVALGNPTVSDNSTGTATVANNAPTQFLTGTNTVVWTATDACNNSSSCTQLVIVADNEPPSVSCPANMLVKAVNPEGAVVTFAADAGDNSAHLTVTYNPASGSLFSIGVTPVTCTAVDGAGNSNSCSFSVTVVDAVSFRILSIKTEGNDVRLTWTMPQGCTGVVQAATGSLTNYSDISEPIYVPGNSWTTTNYLDVGGMTNTPARYYRIRLAP